MLWQKLNLYAPIVSSLFCSPKKNRYFMQKKGLRPSLNDVYLAEEDVMKNRAKGVVKKIVKVGRN